MTNIINSAPVQEQKENVINWLIYKAKKIFKTKEIHDTIFGNSNEPVYEFAEVNLAIDIDFSKVKNLSDHIELILKINDFLVQKEEKNGQKISKGRIKRNGYNLSLNWNNNITNASFIRNIGSLSQIKILIKGSKMSTEEKWEKWEPIEGLTGYYYIDSICNNKYGLKIILVNRKDKKKELHITFDTGVYCSRDTDDSYTIDKITAICERQGDEELFRNTSFFKVTNSEYVKWVSEMSRGISDYQPLEHLVIVTEDSTFEILTNYRPKAEFINL